MFDFIDTGINFILPIVVGICFVGLTIYFAIKIYIHLKQDLKGEFKNDRKENDEE